MSEAPARLVQIRAVIARAETDAGRAPGSVALVAVSKTFEAPDIEPVLAAGQRIFGENRVQEAQRKWPALRERWPDVELHLIGPLQSNKAREAVALFDAIHTVDRPSLAAALAREIARQGRAPRLLVQVNTGEEAQKAGVAPQDADAFLAACRGEHGLPVAGLMCIPPVDQAPGPHFALLAEIARRNGLSMLSMGMSADFETAIELGATHVRVGSAIFGHR
ncbi:YggS family pyridoxal phosphate-dependent enzyme [Labrys wisconsinensis]|uniref:Pyridoxal phosphate homeostasis protein n=1 Tax=Labrys wisconsinensis TaxID=425677 RepID=A0ABU0JMY6_9HYPH|nr:YggS family pyridoxal phosphate-dependent enzyme [Labrys wisconsinensis]MDQ0474659.1 pyridoxal phosphate enzyme (YggS family) [Labrys wisconsinensis]